MTVARVVRAEPLPALARVVVACPAADAASAVRAAFEEAALAAQVAVHEAEQPGAARAEPGGLAAASVAEPAAAQALAQMEERRLAVPVVEQALRLEVRRDGEERRVAAVRLAGAARPSAAELRQASVQLAPR